MDYDEDTVDAALVCQPAARLSKKVPSIEALNSEMPCKSLQKEKGRKMIKSLLNRLRLRRCASVTISRPDPTYRVAYLGNVVTGWAKGDGCVEKPLATLWRNYTQSSRPDVRMQLTVSSGGLKATTKDHGLTEYWAHRLTTCAAPPQFPRLFCWVYRHEGRRLRHELRCHAVLCPTAALAHQIETELKHALQLALAEFKREKISKQNARLSLVNSLYENPTIPRRKILLSTGALNYKPPLERSKSAPKLTSIEEMLEEEGLAELQQRQVYRKILRHYDSALDKRRCFLRRRCESVPEAAVERDAELTLDEKSDRILDELVQNSLRNDMLESCERAWFSKLGEKPGDSGDEGSLSSGCESAGSTVTASDLACPAIAEEPPRKTDSTDFKVGGSVLARVRSFERANGDFICGIGGEEVSLIPVGESYSDFSSLKVYKRKKEDLAVFGGDGEGVEEGDEGEDESACSDESGYEEEEIMSSVANIVLV